MKIHYLLVHSFCPILLLVFFGSIPFPLLSYGTQPKAEEDAFNGFFGDKFQYSSLISTDRSVESNLSEIDPIVLEEFVDNFFNEQTLTDFQVPGAVVTFVRNDEVLLSKGFGWANISTAEEINSNNTVFRAGSVSKSFVATAVMQLYEQGLLNLSTDINDYLLTFKINDTYPDQPITMSHLLTHTAGFDEVWNGMTANDSEITPLGEFLASNFPKRIFSPGEVICYSNFGFALAGYIVELIAGVPFSDYVKSNILEPLGMNSSGFEQPMPPNILSNAAQGYYVSNESNFVPIDLYYFIPYPAGAFYTTGADISRFMLAHLNGGTYNNQSILNESTVQYMHARQFSHHPQLEGFCYGFYEYIEPNFRAIHHAGDLYGFSSELMLFPEQTFGYFISQNSVGTGLREVFTAVFVNEFLPSTYIPPQSTDDFQDRMDLYTGTFWHTRYSHENYEEFKEVIPISSIVLSVDEDSALLLTNLTEGEVSIMIEWIEIESFLFQLHGTNIKLALQLVDGKIKYIFLGISSYERQEVEHTSTSITPSSSTTHPTTQSTPFVTLVVLLISLNILIIKRRIKKP